MITYQPPYAPEPDATPEEMRAYYATFAREEARDWEWFCFLMACSIMVLSFIGYLITR